MVNVELPKPAGMHDQIGKYINVEEMKEVAGEKYWSLLPSLKNRRPCKTLISKK